MAILDRPLFQRRPTMDQLRQYGLPAFANGGVVQRFSNGGDANKPPFLADRTDTAVDPEILFKNRNLPPVGTVIRDEIIENEKGEKIRIIETVVQGARGMKVVQTKEEVVFKPSTTVKTPRGDKVIPAQGDEDATVNVDTAISTPVPKEIKDAENPDQLREAILQQEGPGQNVGLSKAIEEQEKDRDPLGPEKDKLSELEALVRERSDLYKSILGDPKEGLKQQGLLQLAQFGLNLASARGGNFAEKIAKSAKDPLQTFAALGRESLKDERAIDMLAIKGAEDEMARTQKVGTFGQLVNDILRNNPGMDRKDAVKEAYDLSQAKSGKTPLEIRTEAYNMYYADFSARGEEPEDAARLAKELVAKDFGLTEKEQETTEAEVKRAT